MLQLSVKSTVKISSNFVAFLENIDFNYLKIEMRLQKRLRDQCFAGGGSNSGLSIAQCLRSYGTYCMALERREMVLTASFDLTCVCVCTIQ